MVEKLQVNQKTLLDLWNTPVEGKESPENKNEEPRDILSAKRNW